MNPLQWIVVYLFVVPLTNFMNFLTACITWVNRRLGCGFVAIILFPLISILCYSAVYAKGIIDPHPDWSDGSWASTNGENPQFRDTWLVTCGHVTLYGAPGWDKRPVGGLPKDTRVLATEVWQGWAYLYVEKAWVRIVELCETTQPPGW